jgi:hypothetical protein
MADRAGQLDVSHTLTAHLGAGYFNAAFIADNTLVADFLIFTAKALKILGRSKNSFAEKAVPLRFQGTIVDCLRFGDFSVRPAPNLFG